jgi:inosine-5'-monophosphate dehydrogenase
MSNGLGLFELFEKNKGDSLGYADIILMPGYIGFPASDVNLGTQLTRNIRLNLPFVSSPMDTVTESNMAIAMALNGGIGIIHCNNTIPEQVEQIQRVKRYCNGFISDPVVVKLDDNVDVVLTLLSQHHFSGFPVVSDDGKLKGMISKGDVDLVEDTQKTLVKDVMCTDVVTDSYEITLAQAHQVILEQKIKRLPLVDREGKLRGLVCRKDIREAKTHPLASIEPKSGKLMVGAAVTTHPRDRDRVHALVTAGVDVIVLDSACGSSVYQVEALRWIKETYPKMNVIAGNVVTASQARLLIDAGADGLRCGMGIGCFAAHTPILMSNGTYKPIIDVSVGDRVINMYGEPVTVTGKMNNGFRDVIKVKFSKWPEPVYVTPNHLFWLADLSQVNSLYRSKIGVVQTLKKNKAVIDWNDIGSCDTTNYFSMMPNIINYELSETLTIDLAKFTQRGEVQDTHIITSASKTTARYLTSCYDLGYIFGTFLGDGHSFIKTCQKERGNSTIGRVSWYFGPQEQEIATKLQKCIDHVFDQTVVIDETPKIINVHLYNKMVAEFFYSFGKKTEKHLPSQYMCKDVTYIKGLYDGLIDSDGCVEKNRHTFVNTSLRLVELFGWCCSMLNISYGYTMPPINAGNLKEANIENFNQSYRVYTISGNRYLDDVNYGTIVSIEKVEEQQEVWDIEVDCESHSFIAANNIVHNSICTTQDVCGVGRGQASTVFWTSQECRQHINGLIPIIADGGISSSGDIIKALALGASCVMMGGLLAACDESPSETVIHNGVKLKRYRGMGAKTNKNSQTVRSRYGVTENIFVPQGVEGRVVNSGSVNAVIPRLAQATRQGFQDIGAISVDAIQSGKCLVYAERRSAGAQLEGNVHHLYSYEK